MLPSSTTRSAPRRPRRRTAAGLALAVVATACSLLATAQPAAATTVVYAGSTTAEQSSVTIHRGDVFERRLGLAGTVDARLDDAADRITSAKVRFQPTTTPTFAGPFGLKVYVQAFITQLGDATGTARPVAGQPGIGAVTTTVSARMGLAVYASDSGAQHPETDLQLADPTRCTIDLKLSLAGRVDRRTGALSLDLERFAIPSFPDGSADPARTCGFATGELNTQVAGPNNAISLRFSGGPTSAHYTGATAGTRSTLSIKRGSPLRRTVHPAGELTADIDFATGKVTDVVATFRPITMRALPGILQAVPVDARFAMSLSGRPTGTIKRTAKPGIYDLTVTTKARVGIAVLLWGRELTNTRACAVNVGLTLRGTVDSGTNAVTLSASGFTIPSFPAGGCGPVFAPALTLLVSGSSNALTLGYRGGRLR